MDDLTYILKICIQAVNILLACEIGLFLLAKRKGQSKELKRTSFQPKLTLNTYWGFFFQFLFSAIGYVFYGLETRWDYFFPGASVLVDGPLRVLDNIKEISFIYAFSSMLLMVYPLITRIRFRIPLIIALVVFPLALAASPLIFYVLVCIIIPFGIFLFVFLRAFVQLTQGHLQKQFLCIFFGFVLYCTSYVMITHLFDPLFQFGESYIPEVVMLLGLVVMGAGFFTLPSLNEAFSAAVIEQIFLATKEGKIIVRHDFRTAAIAGDIDDTTFTSSIVGIEGLLREISATKGRVKALDQGEKIFLIDRIGGENEQTSNLFAILVTRLDLHVLRSELLNVVYDVETNFLGDILNREELPEATRVKIAKLIEGRFNVQSFTGKRSLRACLLDAAHPKSV